MAIGKKIFTFLIITILVLSSSYAWDCSEIEGREIILFQDSVDRERIQMPQENITLKNPKRISPGGWPITNGMVLGELPVAGVTYRVQFLALKKSNKLNEKFSNLILEYGKPYCYEGDGYFKFALGEFDNYRDALRFKDELLILSDEMSCFIVAFKGDLQIK